MPPKGTRKLKAPVETDEQRKQREEKERFEQLKMQLIKLVREYPVLYDTAHPDHLNSSITDVLWEEIANNLGIDGKDFINMQNKYFSNCNKHVMEIYILNMNIYF